MRKAIILGASPDGICTAREMLGRGVWPIILESSGFLDNRSFFPFNTAQITVDHYAAITGEIHLHQLIRNIYFVRDELCSIHTVNYVTGELNLFTGDLFYSSLSLPGVVAKMGFRPRVQLPEKPVFKNWLNAGTIHPGV